jgi:hypothetical protein
VAFTTNPRFWSIGNPRASVSCPSLNAT